ncbi:hypothetical protein C7M70_17495 [Serratia marcescens]|nr:hypothetical protein C7M66_12275 [Serratia marcescens]AXX22664.1 hypothetical protein C7M65_00855 [Serratia marcescens]RTE97880.1 hypothetical protein C7M70_17495 [Serratia marcescens]RTF04185.1 hypothetical protein C7M68_07130 [Serratia marcescens]RTF10724.1 hypothetical protein C7M69_20485 [Serratia marcescens]
MASRDGLTSGIGLVLRGSLQLLHKYDETFARPESFQRTSNLARKNSQVKCGLKIDSYRIDGVYLFEK